MNRRWLWLMGAGLTLLPGVRGVCAQVLVSTGPDPSCNCRIELERVAQLGRVEDTIAILETTRVARDSRGRFYATSILPYSAIAIYEADGRFRTAIGRRGNGPGEFTRLRSVRVGTGDSLFVHQDSRMTVLSPTWEYARSAEMPAPPSAFWFVVLGNGTVVLNNHFPTQPSFAYFDVRHRLVRGFGRSVNGDRFRSDDLLFRLAAADSGRFVAFATHHRYLAQVWDTTGRLIRELERQPAWYPPYKREDRAALGFASRFPVVMDAYVDLRERRIWTAAWVPDTSWNEPACRPVAGRTEGSNCAAIPIAKRPRAHDAIIEVLDLTTGRPLISQRFDRPVSAFTEGGLIYELREDVTGLMVVDVYRPRIVTGR